MINISKRSIENVEYRLHLIPLMMEAGIITKEQFRWRLIKTNYPVKRLLLRVSNNESLAYAKNFNIVYGNDSLRFKSLASRDPFGMDDINYNETLYRTLSRILACEINENTFIKITSELDVIIQVCVKDTDYMKYNYPEIPDKRVEEMI